MLTEDIADTIVAGAEADLKVAENTSGDSKEETAGIFKRDPRVKSTVKLLPEKMKVTSTKQ